MNDFPGLYIGMIPWVYCGQEQVFPGFHPVTVFLCMSIPVLYVLNIQFKANQCISAVNEIQFDGRSLMALR
jgi:hypothetical protein